MFSRPPFIAGLLAAAAGALALLHGLVTPVFETPDALAHYGYVRHLAAGRGLPVQPPSVGGHEAQQEASQPPLYYALVAALTAWVPAPEFHLRDRLNPHLQTGNGLAYGNKNSAIARPEDDFPYRGDALIIHLARLLSALLLAGSVLCTYAAGRELWPKAPGRALAAAALVGFLPSVVFLAGALTNDNPTLLLASAGLWLGLRALRRGAGPGEAARLGAIGGLAALTKLSGLTFLPLLVLAAAVGGHRHGRRPWLNAAVTALVAVLIAGWWYARNWALYGDPTGLNMMLGVVGRRPPTFSLASLVEEWGLFRVTFWGLFGTDNAMADGLLYAVGDLAALLAGLGLVVAMVRRARAGARPGRAGPWLFLLAWVALVVAGYLRWTLSTEANHGRHLYAALAPLALLFVAGWGGLLPRRFATAAPAAFAAFLFAFSVIAPWRYILPAHAASPLLAAGERPGAGWQELGYRYGGRLALEAIRLPEPGVRPGDWLEVELIWAALAPMERDYSLFLHVDQPDGTRVAQEDSYPGLGSRPTRYLRPGDRVWERHRLFIRPDAPAPAALVLRTGVYDLAAGGARLPAAGPDGGSLPEEAEIGRVLLWGPDAPPPVAARTARFGDGVELAGYELGVDGTTLRGALWWRAWARPAQDYTVFLHLVGPASTAPLAQRDAPPLGGNLPTGVWLPGMVARDPVALPLPVGVAGVAGLRVRAGLYDPATGRRLITSDGADSVELSLTP